jgi:hypothetical protein
MQAERKSFRNHSIGEILTEFQQIGGKKTARLNQQPLSANVLDQGGGADLATAGW